MSFFFLPCAAQYGLTYFIGDEYAASSKKTKAPPPSVPAAHEMDEDPDVIADNRLPDARQDPYEDPETDGLDPRQFDEDHEVEQAQSDPATAQAFVRSMVSVLARCLAYTYDFDIAL